MLGLAEAAMCANGPKASRAVALSTEAGAHMARWCGEVEQVQLAGRCRQVGRRRWRCWCPPDVAVRGGDVAVRVRRAFPAATAADYRYLHTTSCSLCV